MCKDCGCGRPDPAHDHEHAHEHDHGHEHPHAHAHDHPHPHPGTSRTVPVREAVLSFNDRLAEQNRGFFRARGLFAVNLLSSPGAGKTLLIERTVTGWAEASRVAVIVGDLQTENDANRIRACGVEAVQVTTGEVCHLDAHMVQHALESLPLPASGLLLVENVGNLVCPASFDLGEHARVVLMSVTEGEDKPLKYPVIFHRADLVLITKIDLATAVEFDGARAREHIARVAPHAKILELSAKTGEGLDAWRAWLLEHATHRHG